MNDLEKRRDVIEIFSRLSEDDLKNLCWTFECYPHYGDQSKEGLTRSICNHLFKLASDSNQLSELRAAHSKVLSLIGSR